MDKILKLILQKDICMIAMEFIGLLIFCDQKYMCTKIYILKLLKDWPECKKKKKKTKEN